METHKIDKDIRQKLEQRTISPSADAWSQLSHQLDAAEKKSTKKYWWLGIAASFLTGIIISGFVFQYAQQPTPQTPVVDTGDVHEPVSTSEENKKGTPVIIAAEEKEIEQKEKKPLGNQQPMLAVETKQPVEKVNFRATNFDIDNYGLKLKEEQSAMTENFIEEKGREILAEVKLMKQYREVTDAEIDDLIRKAQLEIRAKKFLDHPSNKIDAQVLLEGVEAELDQNFRQRIFNAIENGYDHIKAVVVSRNY